MISDNWKLLFSRCRNLEGLFTLRIRHNEPIYSNMALQIGLKPNKHFFISLCRWGRVEELESFSSYIDFENERYKCLSIVACRNKDASMLKFLLSKMTSVDGIRSEILSIIVSDTRCHHTFKVIMDDVRFIFPSYYVKDIIRHHPYESVKILLHRMGGITNLNLKSNELIDCAILNEDERVILLFMDLIDFSPEAPEPTRITPTPWSYSHLYEAIVKHPKFNINNLDMQHAPQSHCFLLANLVTRYRKVNLDDPNLDPVIRTYLIDNSALLSPQASKPDRNSLPPG
jgi:hypothetical protein